MYIYVSPRRKEYYRDRLEIDNNGNIVIDGLKEENGKYKGSDCMGEIDI